MTAPIEFSVKRYSARLPVPRPLLIAEGIVTPTPAERAEIERRHAEYQRRAAARAEVLAAARERLAEITDPVVRAVLDLHAENERGECTGDDIDGYEAEYPEWPCRTVEAVAAHYGIPMEAS